METRTLKNKLEEVRDILVSLERLKTDITFISDKKAKYFPEVIEHSSFFYRVYRNSIKLYIIDICKLLNPEEYYSLPKTLNYILSNRKRIVWEREITSTRIKELQSFVDELNSNNYKSFKNLRDKHYAHNDKNKYDYAYDVTLKKCWSSLEVLQDVFVELSLCLSNEQYIFELYTTKPSEVISLLRYKNINRLINSNLKRGPDIGELQIIRDIILGKNIHMR